jgi:hypothetical protein
MYCRSNSSPDSCESLGVAEPPDHPPRTSDHWKHDTFLAAVTASIELAVLSEPEKYEYIFHDEIVLFL